MDLLSNLLNPHGLPIWALVLMAVAGGLLAVPGIVRDRKSNGGDR